MESWLNASVEDRESFSSPDDMGCMEISTTTITAASKRNLSLKHFLSIFTKRQASSPFEAMNSAHLSMSQMDMRPSVQKSLRTLAFSRVSTLDSDIRSSCEMKDEPAFKALHGKPAFF